MKKQIHESFETFTVNVKDGKIEGKSKKALTEFLNASHIHARSISTLHKSTVGENGSDEILVCIGHDNKKMKKDMKYEVSIKKLGDNNNVPKAIDNLNKFSKKAKSVVCHSLLLLEDNVYAFLLVTKEANA